MRQHRSIVALVTLGFSCLAAGTAALFFTVSGPVLAQFEREPFTDQACLDCHTDQARLTELAVVEQEDEKEALSSGPG